MKGLKIILFSAFIFGNFYAAKAQYITVDETKNAQQLTEDILVNSSCANVSNFSVSGDLSSGSKKSYAAFSSGTSNFPFTEGVLLSTWSSSNSVGPFIRNLGGGDTSWKGDADLNQTIEIKSVNATSLEFDFTPLTNFISFNYIFASNEYQDYFPCEYSDGFAFLIKEAGSSTNYENIAVLPGTTTPVSSTNVHPLINNFNSSSGIISGCPAINQTYFNGYNSFNSPVNYSGQTKVLTAQTYVIPNKTYHIKLVIADDEEEYYDSVVFLEAGSFSSKIDLGQDRLLANNNAVCFGESFIIDTKLPVNYSYKWFKDGVEIPLATDPSYTVTAPGIYTVDVILSAGCTATEDIKIEYIPKIDLKNALLIQCDDDNDGISVFDLTKIDSVIKNGISGLSNLEYFESLIAAQGQTNPIPNPTAYKNTVPDQIVFVRVTNALGCPAFAEVTLTTSNHTITSQTVATCDSDGLQDGLHEFDLNSQITPQILNGLPSGLLVNYYLNENDAILEKNPLPNLFTTSIPNQQTLFARIINGSDCYGISAITLVTYTFDFPNFEDENLILCKNSAVDLSVGDGFSSYLWNTGSTSNLITITTSGNYSVKVTDLNGCEKTKNFNVIPSETAIITDSIITDFNGNVNSVSIQYTGIGDYEFSLDGLYFQESPVFDGVLAGSYLAYARDKNGCGLSIPYPVYVMDYPRYFTPNGDGYNDLWKIKNLNLFPNAIVTIFDRYGKLLKQLSATSNGWNGTFNGLTLPSDDYWFQLILDDRTIKGHFSLKR
ncbi:T9SS type B sorting domain-containing protein [Flavobacterium lacustre]|uniref:T9SS type B sorting domain-containing protein n=1 Tax=Flavobacterium lacustre TaxID=3016339 RepID=UPI0022B702EE|nr:choice-of-anchor L domain-containing protein [Flavobacterium lacustre]